MGGTPSAFASLNDAKRGDAAYVHAYPSLSDDDDGGAPHLILSRRRDDWTVHPGIRTVIRAVPGDPFRLLHAAAATAASPDAVIPVVGADGVGLCFVPFGPTPGSLLLCAVPGPLFA